MITPTLLPPNTVPSFYPGAARIAAFRRDDTLDPTNPEDWIASTTARTGLFPSGMSSLPDGLLLAEHFTSDPVGWFGREHVARHGAASGLLVKLLDAGQRLPLHAHPTRRFAHDHLASAYGKTEAWIIIAAEPGAAINLGFSRHIPVDELAEWVHGQDTTAMLAATNQVPVHPGDVLLCPAGVPHAIGDGILTIELQEPTDFSIMLEWRNYPVHPGTAFLGMSAATALRAVHRSAVTPSVIDQLRGQHLTPLGSPAAPTLTSLLPPQAGEFFVAEQVLPQPVHTMDQRFSLLVINEGSATLIAADQHPINVTTGQTYLIPHAAGPATLRGPVSAVRCYAR